MFERLTRFFHAKAAPPAPLPEPDARLALGTLLVKVAQADRTYLFEEIAQIDRILAKAYGLKPIEAAKMRAQCEKIAHALHDDADLAGRIRDAVDYEHRLEAVEALWQVVRADGSDDERETALVELVEETLGIERADSQAARSAASIP